MMMRVKSSKYWAGSKNKKKNNGFLEIFDRWFFYTCLIYESRRNDLNIYHQVIEEMEQELAAGGYLKVMLLLEDHKHLQKL